MERELRTVSLGEAAAALRAGGVVLVPTETVVGLVAAESGLSRVRDVKSREADKPIALLCSSADEAFSLAREVPRLATKLAELYWPGPLTLVLDRPEGGTVGLRVPAGRTAQELLSAYGGPLFATSANVSGEPAPHALEGVDPRVSGAVDLAVVGEPGSGEASAVVDLSGGGPQRGDTLKVGRLLSEASGLLTAQWGRTNGGFGFRESRVRYEPGGFC